MKGKMKIPIYIIAAVMMIFMLAGCGDDKPPAPPEIDTQTEITDGGETTEQTEPIGGSGDIGAKKVKEIVLAKVPGAVEDSIYEFEREIDDGRVEYEGGLYHDGYEYEFEVDGATGNILQWEIDD